MIPSRYMGEKENLKKIINKCKHNQEKPEKTSSKDGIIKYREMRLFKVHIKTRYLLTAAHSDEIFMGVFALQSQLAAL